MSQVEYKEVLVSSVGSPRAFTPLKERPVKPRTWIQLVGSSQAVGFNQFLPQLELRGLQADQTTACTKVVIAIDNKKSYP